MTRPLGSLLALRGGGTGRAPGGGVARVSRGRDHQRRLPPVSVVAVLALLLTAGAGRAAGPTADELALRLLDGEALYTVTGGLKPVSEGFWETRFPATQDSSPEVEATRRQLAALPIGPDLEAGVLVFAAPFDGKRFAAAFVAHKPALRVLIGRRPDVFGPLGITAGTPPQEVMERIDRGPRAARWRAFGLVFGYPEYAVEFFVAAGAARDRDGKAVEREFVHVPTFASARGRFVYAVPKGHTERPEDVALKAAAAPILDRYRVWRAVYVGHGTAGAVELLRSWVTPAVVVACPRPADRPTRPFGRIRHR
jgi:hypothetical protein